MEKFALLNLLKAIDGLKRTPNEQNNAAETPPARTQSAEKPEQIEPQGAEIPNIMYETLMRHEQLSNRIRNRK